MSFQFLDAFLAGSLVLTASVAAAQTRPPLDTEWEQVRPLFALVEDAAVGKPVPADLTLTWHCDFFDAQAGVVLVPFSLSVEQGQFTSFPVAMYVRVVLRGAPAPSPGPRDALAQYPFEDAAVFDGLKYGRITRAFTAPPGEYDVYVAMQEPVATDGQPKTVVIKAPVSIPDMKSDLAVSSLVVLDRIDPYPGQLPLDYEEQLANPYALWGAGSLTPALRDTFHRNERFAVLFLIYNAGTGQDGMPDVQVDYTFYRRTGGGDAAFTRIEPETFTARTLPDGFDLKRGDPLVAGQDISLERFESGVYRMNVTVRDNAAGKSLSRDVPFTVTEP